MFNGWHGGGRHQKDNSEKELISTDIINGVYVDVPHVLRDADAITRSSALRVSNGTPHSCANCPKQFSKGT